MEEKKAATENLFIAAPDGSDMRPGLVAFANFIGLERVAPGRYSMLLVLGLFLGHASGKLNPANVVQEISALEGVGKPSFAKPPVQNKHAPLKGLWHKHYVENGLPSLAKNLKNGLVKYGLPELVAHAKGLAKPEDMTGEMFGKIAHEAVIGNYERRVAKSEMTGEWLVYAQHEGRNYYLCIGTHDSSTHEDLRQKIDTISCKEFPFLSKLLADA